MAMNGILDIFFEVSSLQLIPPISGLFYHENPLKGVGIVYYCRLNMVSKHTAFGIHNKILKIKQIEDFCVFFQACSLENVCRKFYLERDWFPLCMVSIFSVMYIYDITFSYC